MSKYYDEFTIESLRTMSQEVWDMCVQPYTDWTRTEWLRLEPRTDYIFYRGGLVGSINAVTDGWRLDIYDGRLLEHIGATDMAYGCSLNTFYINSIKRLKTFLDIQYENLDKQFVMIDF
jgi:hypothetical protein